MQKHFLRFYLVILLLAALLPSTVCAADQKARLINDKKHLDVFLAHNIAHISSKQKLPASFIILDYGLHRCTLEGVAWREDEKVFDAMLVETSHVLCKGKKYPAKFYSRIIADKDLDLSGKSALGSHAKASIEIFLVRF